MMKIIASMVMGVLALLVGCQQANVANLGTITLINGNGTKCNVSVVRGHHYYELGDLGCGNDNVYNFELSGLPAGVLIKFCDEPDCKKASGPGVMNGWVYQIQTLKRDSSIVYELDMFNGALVGAVPNRAFKIVDVHENDGQQVHGKLSRVEVKYCTAGDTEPCPKSPTKS